ncbi:MAG: glycosyltransferase [Marinosulfonomonas sp.]
MAHLAFVSPVLPSHMKASLALGVLLKDRGHRITFIGPPDAKAVTQAHGIAFHEIGATVQPLGDLAKQLKTLARVRGVRGIGRHIRKMAETTQMFLDGLPAALDELQPTGMIVDQMEPAGGLVARAKGIPFVSLANALPVERDPIVPPVFANWPPETTEFALKRNETSYRVADFMMRRQWSPMTDFAQRFDLRLETIEDTLSPLATLVTLPKGFDFPRSRHQDKMHHVGPIRLPEPEGEVSPELAAICETDRPLVYASFGTMFGGRLGMFRKLAKVCDRLGYQLVVSHCQQLSPAQEKRIGYGAFVTGHLPQRWMLERSDICVTHGGLNTVVDCLELKVPMVAAPMSFDHPALGARITWTQTGICLPPSKWSVARLTNALLTVLQDKSYVQNGAEMRRALAENPSSRCAPELVEQVLGLSHRDIHAKGPK